MTSYKTINDFYFDDDDLNHIKDLLPDSYIASKDSLIDSHFLVRNLQNLLNEMLNSYLNGGFSNAGYALYPLIKGTSKNGRENLKILKTIIELLSKEGHDFSNSISIMKKEGSEKLTAELLSSAYAELKEALKKTQLKSKPSMKEKCRELDLSAYNEKDFSYIRPLSEIKDYSDEKLSPYLSGFYLHGSLATRDYIKGWSDVDTLAIVSKESTENPSSLKELRKNIYLLRKYFYKIDPLQHHGSIIISEHDMESYCQAYFPVPALNYAVSFFGSDRKMQFNAREYRSEALRDLFWFVSYFRKLKSGGKYSLNSYDTKALLHSITLFPSLYLQSKGILMYKKFSFEMARKDFSNEEWKIIEYVSGLRSKWKIKSFTNFAFPVSFFNPLLSHQISFRANDIFGTIAAVNGINIKKTVEEMHLLSEKAWQNAKNNDQNK